MKKTVVVTRIMVTFLCGEIVYANRHHHVNQNYYTGNLHHDEVGCENYHNNRAYYYESANCSKGESCLNDSDHVTHHYNNVNQRHRHYSLHH